MNIAEKYIDDVISGGQELVCKYASLAVQRHVRDLETGIDRGLRFDRREGERALKWFTFLRHSKGAQFAGKPFVLSGWQAFITWSLFGWKRADGTRRFNYAYVEVAKKNGKSTFAAAIGLYMQRLDKEPRAEIYTAATKKEQAKIVLNEARNMVKSSPGIGKYFTVFQHNIHCDDTGSLMEALAADSQKQDGLGPHCAIIDEYHAHTNDELINNIKSGMGARRQPLMFIITTAGMNRQVPCFTERKTCIDILQGIKQQDNKFAIIFTLDEDDQWDNPALWYKANPNLDISVSLKFLLDEMDSAKNNEREIVNFKTKHLNIWTDSVMAWIKDEDWVTCDLGLDLEQLKGRRCWGGLDLASHVDINAMALVFEPDQDDVLDVWMFFWVPEEKVKERKDIVDYDLWVKQGCMIATPGNVIDIDYLASDIMDIFTWFDLVSIAFDPARAYHGLVQILQKNDLPLQEYRQNTVAMDTPVREIEKRVLSKKLNHGGNPMLRWMNTNVVIYKDSSGNIKVDRRKSTEKVDGMVALAMAIGNMMTPDEDYVEMDIR